VLVGALVPDLSRPKTLGANEDPSKTVACAEWGDGCKVCRRTEGGPACSLPGIACTPGAVTCLRGAGQP